MFYFHPYLGKISNLTNIFQRGWNHQVGILADSFPHQLSRSTVFTPDSGGIASWGWIGDGLVSGKIGREMEHGNMLNPLERPQQKDRKYMEIYHHGFSLGNFRVLMYIFWRLYRLLVVARRIGHDQSVKAAWWVTACGHLTDVALMHASFICPYMLNRQKSWLNFPRCQTCSNFAHEVYEGPDSIYTGERILFISSCVYHWYSFMDSSNYFCLIDTWCIICFWFTGYFSCCPDSKYIPSTCVLWNAFFSAKNREESFGRSIWNTVTILLKMIQQIFAFNVCFSKIAPPLPKKTWN